MIFEMIPVVNLKAQFSVHEKSIREAVNRVFKSGRYILGSEVRRFEEEFGAFVGAANCVGVGSGTDAIALGLKSLGVVAGDEVITVSHTAVATVAAIEQIGAVPVFVDIDPVSRCMDSLRVAAMISARTKALVVVHIYGQPADMQAIMSIARNNGLKVLEDCAQAHGAEISGQKVGTFGDAAAFSFYPTKNLGALGDGGAVVTNEMETGFKCRCLREYGWKERYISHLPGFNSRLDELQAAILRAKLALLGSDNERRRWIASRYNSALQGGVITPPAEIDGTIHAMHLYVVETLKRNELQVHLEKHGISSSIHYPAPIHRQPAYLGKIRGGKNLPVTEALYEKILTLPMYPEIAEERKRGHP